jgi:hypothetical protein
MANKNDLVVATTPQPTTEVPLSLHEFCTRLSSEITSPELIAAFEHTERASGCLSDVSAGFKARFDKFVKSPV